MILHPAPVSTKQLTYHPKTNRYVGEISSTNGFGQVYDDACDVGLTLVSAKTGREVVFVVTCEARDADGDITYWVLSPADTAAGVWAAGSITLFND